MNIVREGPAPSGRELAWTAFLTADRGIRGHYIQPRRDVWEAGADYGLDVAAEMAEALQLAAREPGVVGQARIRIIEALQTYRAAIGKSS